MKRKQVISTKELINSNPHDKLSKRRTSVTPFINNIKLSFPGVDLEANSPPTSPSATHSNDSKIPSLKNVAKKNELVQQSYVNQTQQHQQLLQQQQLQQQQQQQQAPSPIQTQQLQQNQQLQQQIQQQQLQLQQQHLQLQQQQIQLRQQQLHQQYQQLQQLQLQQQQEQHQHRQQQQEQQEHQHHHHQQHQQQQHQQQHQQHLQRQHSNQQLQQPSSRRKLSVPKIRSDIYNPHYSFELKLKEKQDFSADVASKSNLQKTPSQSAVEISPSSSFNALSLSTSGESPSLSKSSSSSSSLSLSSSTSSLPTLTPSSSAEYINSSPYDSRSFITNPQQINFYGLTSPSSSSDFECDSMAIKQQTPYYNYAMHSHSVDDQSASASSSSTSTLPMSRVSTPPSPIMQYSPNPLTPVSSPPSFISLSPYTTQPVQQQPSSHQQPLILMQPITPGHSQSSTPSTPNSTPQTPQTLQSQTPTPTSTPTPTPTPTSHGEMLPPSSNERRPSISERRQSFNNIERRSSFHLTDKKALSTSTSSLPNHNRGRRAAIASPDDIQFLKRINRENTMLSPILNQNDTDSKEEKEPTKSSDKEKEDNQTNTSTSSSASTSANGRKNSIPSIFDVDLGPINMGSQSRRGSISGSSSLSSIQNERKDSISTILFGGLNGRRSSFSTSSLPSLFSDYDSSLLSTGRRDSLTSFLSSTPAYERKDSVDYHFLDQMEGRKFSLGIPQILNDKIDRP